jgi:hypothetical protein
LAPANAGDRVLAGLQRVATAASARLEAVAPAVLAYARPVCRTNEPRCGDDSDNRAEEIELEDVTGSEPMMTPMTTRPSTCTEP